MIIVYVCGLIIVHTCAKISVIVICMYYDQRNQSVRMYYDQSTSMYDDLITCISFCMPHSGGLHIMVHISGGQETANLPNLIYEYHVKRMNALNIIFSASSSARTKLTKDVLEAARRFVIVLTVLP